MLPLEKRSLCIMWILGGKWISKITRKSTLSSILALFRNIEKYKLVIWPEYSISLPNHYGTPQKWGKIIHHSIWQRWGDHSAKYFPVVEKCDKTWQSKTEQCAITTTKHNLKKDCYRILCCCSNMKVFL